MPSRAGQARFPRDGQKGVHMAGSPGRRRRGLLSAVVAALVATGTLAACGGTSGGSGSSGGSATSGDITWWGWTPTVQGAAAYIKAFNKVYPDIHITFKEITIAGYDADMRPALAVSGVGPDIFGIAPGAGLALYAPDAINLEPAIAKALDRTGSPSSRPSGPA